MKTELEEKYWFKRKRQGLGLEPASWEGWLVTLAYISGLVFLVMHFGEEALDDGLTKDIALPAIGLTVLFILIAIRKGEKFDFLRGFRRRR